LDNPLLNVDKADIFYGEAQAVWDVSLKVRKGTIVALIGANGAGKSTLLNAVSRINGLRNGKISFEGKSLSGRTPEDVANLGIAHVPEGRRLFARMTVLENLELGAYPPSARPYSKQSLENVYALFPVLRDRSFQFAGSLSGGEQQMLAIGRALMARPSLLMLDEPSLGLAPIIVKQMFEIIEKLNQQGMTILLVEQNVHQTLEISDYAYVLQTGHLINEGDGKDLLGDTDFQKAYLGC
jgi:branched-chain amino acid transport system ATP-binding protein